MVILSHRGYWKEATEKNAPVAFARSLALGFGIETDLRDFGGELVISHNVADEQCRPAAAFFSDYQQTRTNLPLALNIKADGLQTLLKQLLDSYQVQNYFVFDMSVPDTLPYLKLGFNVFTRESEYEPQPSFYEQATGVWMDCFLSDWIESKDIARHLDAGKRVCIVSPELHGRSHLPFWQRLAQGVAPGVGDELMLCTDYPEEARSFFDG